MSPEVLCKAAFPFAASKVRVKASSAVGKSVEVVSNPVCETTTGGSVPGSLPIGSDFLQAAANTIKINKSTYIFLMVFVSAVL
jgi:hypothetical protein